MAEAGGDFYLCILCGCVLSSKFSDESDHFIPDNCVLEAFCEMGKASDGGGGTFWGGAFCPMPDFAGKLPGHHGRYGLFYCACNAGAGLWMAGGTPVCALRGNKSLVGGDFKRRGPCLLQSDRNNDLKSICQYCGSYHCTFSGEEYAGVCEAAEKAAGGDADRLRGMCYLHGAV